MANNRTLIRGRQLAMIPTNGGVNAGDPCMVGNLPAVSLNGRPQLPGYPGGTPSSTTPQALDTLGVYNLFVKGVGPSGNLHIMPGDLIYHDGSTVYDPTGAVTTPLSVNTGGKVFGVALGVARTATGIGTQSGYGSAEIIASGATGFIDIRLGGV